MENTLPELDGFRVPEMFRASSCFGQDPEGTAIYTPAVIQIVQDGFSTDTIGSRRLELDDVNNWRHPAFSWPERRAGIQCYITTDFINDYLFAVKPSWDLTVIGGFRCCGSGRRGYVEPGSVWTLHEMDYKRINLEEYLKCYLQSIGG